MKYVSLPSDFGRRLPFYLAMEEYLARVHPASGEDDGLLFMWQVEPTVIFGRNQVIDSEVNVDYCRSRGIAMYRRRSGGGCVFANRDNIMFSYITRCSSPVAVTFRRYTGMIAEMLRSLGLDAKASDRNDILIGDRKVSGNAFYHIPGRSIVHGTMLFDTDREQMAAAITPSAAKLQSRGVSSVRSRVTTIREHLDIDMERFKDHARRFLTDGQLLLTDADIEAIEAFERPYYDQQWIMGRRFGKKLRRQRIEGVGEFQVDVATDSANLITGFDLAGDYFLTADIDTMLVDRLKGRPYTPDGVAEALAGFDVGDVIHGLTNRQLIDLIF